MGLTRCRQTILGIQDACPWSNDTFNLVDSQEKKYRASGVTRTVGNAR